MPRKEIEKQLKKYNIVFIQKETFNVPLLIKYIMHIFTVILNHIIIFFYFPIKGNMNLGIGAYCVNEDQCNDFNNNYLIWIFYLLYLIYIVLSSLQIKYGFFEIFEKMVVIKYYKILSSKHYPEVIQKIFYMKLKMQLIGPLLILV